MNLQAEKRNIIEELISLDDKALILKIKSLLKTSKPIATPMSLQTFYAKIDASEKAYEQGEIISQSVMEKEITTWKRKK